MIQSYRDLVVWQKGMDLVVECYKATEQFPKTEVYGLAGQLRRAAVSVPSNIAEGRGRQHLPEFIQFLHIAQGSLAELETQIPIAHRLNDIEATQCQNLLNQTNEITQMLHGLLRSLKNRKASPPDAHP